MSITILPYYNDEQVLEITAYVIGMTYCDELRAKVAAQTQRDVRPSGAGHINTKDFRPDRIELMVDDQQVIIEVQFG